MLKVGISTCEKTGKILHYPNVKYDADGWADATKYRPVDFDLLYLKIKDIKGIYRGWFTGTSWDGAKLPEGSKILYWKRSRDDE